MWQVLNEYSLQVLVSIITGFYCENIKYQNT